LADRISNMVTTLPKQEAEHSHYVLSVGSKDLNMLPRSQMVTSLRNIEVPLSTKIKNIKDNLYLVKKKN
jgi:hypothetical protein